MSWARCFAVFVILVSAAALIGPEAAVAQTNFRMVLYVEPVQATVVDPFRPPAHIGAPGNRGLEYDNNSQALVVAAADGFVTFSGSVAGRGVITVHHPDDIRTTYTGMSERWVGADSFVDQGEAIGRADAHLHFGARVGQHYVDPQVLIDASQPQLRARLVPPPGS